MSTGQIFCRTIQQAADTGNVKGMYNGIKKATGPSIKKTAPLKSKTEEIFTDKAKQLDRWVEHYSELYSRENVVHQSALDTIDHLSLIPELDEVLSIKDLSKAIDRLPSGKVTLGKDGILDEVIKSSKSTLLVPLHKLLTQCWKEGSIPQDMRDSNIITRCKNKDNPSNCINYHGISLLSIIGKLFVCIILHRLQILADRIYPESQCGFHFKKVNYRHDILPLPTAREVQRSEPATLFCLYRPDQGIWTCEQRWPIQDATTNWLSTKTP